MAKQTNTAVAQSAQSTEAVTTFAGVELKGRKDPKVAIAECKSKSQGIRALASANYTHGEIVKLSTQLPLLQYIDNGKVRMTADGKGPAPIRYQHVRNVLNAPVASAS